LNHIMRLYFLLRILMKRTEDWIGWRDHQIKILCSTEKKDRKKSALFIRQCLSIWHYRIHNYHHHHDTLFTSRSLSFVSSLQHIILFILMQQHFFIHYDFYFGSLSKSVQKNMFIKQQELPTEIWFLLSPPFL
jgi:hypothetical protein